MAIQMGGGKLTAISSWNLFKILWYTILLHPQIIYPAKVTSTQISTEDDNMLLDILTRVGLLNLYNRIGGFDTTVEWTWSDVLTPGEMQCLSFARLFYAKPKFCLWVYQVHVWDQIIAGVGHGGTLVRALDS